MAKTICQVQQTKKHRSRKNSDKDGKALYKLMNNFVYGKQWKTYEIESMWKLWAKNNDYLKWTFKPSYMSGKIFDNDLVVIRKCKVILTLNKPAYIEMRILKY